MKKIEKKFNSELFESLVSKKTSGWHEASTYRINNKDWLNVSFIIGLKIVISLREKGLSKEQFAENIGEPIENVNKWVHGGENFDIKTISRIEKELNIKLITTKTCI